MAAACHRDRSAVACTRDAPRSSAQARRAFTLLELFLAVAIISVLIGLLYPAVRALRRSAKRARAQAEAAALVNAVKLYRATYGKWPCQSQALSDSTHLNCADVMAELATNSRQIAFMDAFPGAVSNGTPMDPWGRPYVLAMDEDGDGNVILKTSSFETMVVGQSAVVLSWGETTNDMVFPWSAK